MVRCRSAKQYRWKRCLLTILICVLLMIQVAESTILLMWLSFAVVNQSNKTHRFAFREDYMFHELQSILMKCRCRSHYWLKMKEVCIQETVNDTSSPPASCFQPVSSSTHPPLNHSPQSVAATGAARVVVPAAAPVGRGRGAAVVLRLACKEMTYIFLWIYPADFGFVASTRAPILLRKW